MKIRIRDIPPDGIELTEQMSVQTIGEIDEGLVKFTVPLEVTARFEKVKNIVLAHTHLQTKCTAHCSRCLELVEIIWDKNFTFDFPVSREVDDIELNDDIRQELVLGLPIHVLCQEECKGLCIGCGANLNTEPCQCKK